MTKEELWNEAKIRVDAFIDNFSQDIRSTLYDRLNQEDVKDFLYGLYVDSAEPREKKIAELEKENTELKRENRGIKTCTNCDEYVIGRCCNYPNGVCHHWKLSEKYRNDDKLTEATEIIRRLMDIINHDLKCFDTIAGLDVKQKAERFLKEIEK